MDNKIQKLKRQAERADKLDNKAREIYKISILVVSILIAAATVSVDLGSLLSSYVFETGFLIDKDGLTIGSEFNGIVFVLLYIFGFVFTIVFVTLLLACVFLFISVPYYAVRAQNCSKVNESGQIMSAILSDSKKKKKYIR